jgi:hypothetical protein
MSHKHELVRPGHKIGTVISESGEVVIPPEDWAFLAAGDAAITRSVKSKGSTWVVQVRRGRRTIAKGIWANKQDIENAQQEVTQKRATPEYKKKRKRDLARKEEKHNNYVCDFHEAVVSFLNFHPRYEQEASKIAKKVTEHATPVGSGTVARTERIPIGKRAEAAVIAWMRHKTTAYDSMRIARIKGRRREVRRNLAGKSIEILKLYRQGKEIEDGCPLQKALM